MIGLSRAVLEYAVPYAKERRAFGQAIAQKQAIAFRLSDMHIETERMRWLTWKAASQLEQGLDATRSAHLARAYAAEQSMWIADKGVQVLGGHGFIREHPVELWYRNARTLGVLEGSRSAVPRENLTDDRFRTLDERRQKILDKVRERRSWRGSTPATTTRTSTSSRPTSCRRRRTTRILGSCCGRTEDDTAGRDQHADQHGRDLGRLLVRMRRPRAALGNAALRAAGTPEQKREVGGAHAGHGDHRARLRLGSVAGADDGGARRATTSGCSTARRSS